MPPLNALKAFEAAGRHLSFAKAAEELSVTPAAISQQVKALEEYLDIPLFRRLPRGLLLTDAGQSVLPQIAASFDDLAAAIDKLRNQRDTGVLTLSILPSFAARWLVPRLARFHARHPEIDLHMVSTVRVIDFAVDNVDVAIRYGLGNWPGMQIDLLRTEEIFPVCSPALLAGGAPLETPHDLRHHMLLHDKSWKTIFSGAYPDWSTWLEAAGVKGIDLSRGPSMTPSELVIQAAISGQGVALGRSVLVENDLVSGRLVKLFDLKFPIDYAYYVVCPEATAERPKIAAFREWLIEEARRTGD